jgi:hypothetical protein
VATAKLWLLSPHDNEANDLLHRGLAFLDWAGKRRGTVMQSSARINDTKTYGRAVSSVLILILGILGELPLGLPAYSGPVA